MPHQILIVDDELDMEPLVLQKLSKQIHDNEFEFFFGHNGEEALDILAEQPGIDLVLTDINMPIMDGLTLLSRLNEGVKPVKTVIVSAYGDMANIRTAMNRGAIDFLTKPIDFADFEVTIRQALRRIARQKKSKQDHDDLFALQRELDLAVRIQRWTQPRTFPPFPGRHDFELHAATAPAKGLSGDAFDYFLVDSTHLGFMIGDVNTTGVAAALFASITRTVLRAIATRGAGPAECLEHLDALLATQQGDLMSLSLFYGLLDTHNGTLQFANKGHAVPYLYSETGGARPLHECRKQREKYHSQVVQMKPGDGLLLYTDGATEAPNSVREWFGDDRLKEHVNAHASGTTEQMVLDLFTALRFFTMGTQQADDITVMALRYQG